MRRAVILLAAALFLIWFYSYLLLYAVEFSAGQPVPVNWSYLFLTPRAALLSWLYLRHTIAVLLASVPFAFVIARLYPRRWLVVALAATAPLYLTTTLPTVVQTFNTTPLRLQIAEIVDAVKLVGMLPLLTWGLRNLPSNMRWSGRAVDKVPGLSS
jgi:hypothetical protein